MKILLQISKLKNYLSAVGTAAVTMGLALLSTEATAAIDTTNITASATDAYTAALAVINAYGSTFLIPVAIISVLWVIGKRFLWRSI